MGTGMRGLVKDTAVYGLSSIIGKILNWMLVPMYTRVLPDTADYGIVSNLYAWVALLLVFLTYGMETGFFRFINRKEEKRPLQVYTAVMISLTCSSLLFLLFLFLFLTPISYGLGYAGYPEFIGMLGFIVALDAICTLPFAYLRFQGKAYRFAGLKLLSIFLNIGLNIFFLIICPKIWISNPSMIRWFYIPGYGVGYIFISNVITTLATLFFLLPEIRDAFLEKFNPQLLKKILRYSFPILILGIAGIFNQTADKILFPFLFEDKEYAVAQLGIYSACFKIAVVMVMFIQAFRYAYEPFIFARNKEDNDHKTYAVAMKYFIIFSLVIFLGVMFYLDILKYFVDPSYFAGLPVVPIIMLGELFFGIYFNLSFWYKLIDQTYWGAWFSLIGCIVTVLIIVLFVPVYGFIACAWASFFCNLLMMILSYVIGQKKFPIRYDLKSAFIYFTIAGIVYIVGMFTPIHNEYIRLLYRTGLLIIFLAFIIKRDIPLKDIPFVNRFIKS